ncbi:unnamed protein product [Closterium sp. NIES-53]
MMCEPQIPTCVLDASQEESGLLEDLFRRHGRLGNPVVAPPFMHNQPRPLFENPQIPNQEESGLLEELSRRHGRLESPTAAPVMYPPRLPMQPQESAALLSRSNASNYSSKVPVLERAEAELFEEEQRQQQRQRQRQRQRQQQRQQQQEQQQQVALERWIAQALSGFATERSVEAPQMPSVFPSKKIMSLSGSGGIKTITGDARTGKESKVEPCFGHPNTTSEGDEATRTESMVAAGPRGINTIEKEAAAATSAQKHLGREATASVQQHLVRQQQVATTSWVAQAELAGLILPPDLIQESAHAAWFAVQMQMQEQAEGGSPSLTGPGSLHSHDSSSLPISPASTAAAAAAGVAAAAAGAAAASSAAAAAAPYLPAAPAASFSPAAAGVCHKGDRGNASKVQQPLGPTGRSLFSPSAPGVCHTSSAPGAPSGPSATPGVCLKRKRAGSVYQGEGHALTMQEHPATWTPLVGSGNVQQWSEQMGVGDENGSVRQAKREEERWSEEDWEHRVLGAKQKSFFEAPQQSPFTSSQVSPFKAPPQASPSQARQLPAEDWRPRIRARLDGQAVGLGCIQPRSMKERCRRDRIR